jgi:hypothetical protein
LTSFNFLSVLETVKILKQESEQITKSLDLLIVHLVENQIDEKIDFIYSELITQQKRETLETNIEKLANTDFNKGVKNPC